MRALQHKDHMCKGHEKHRRRWKRRALTGNLDTGLMLAADAHAMVKGGSNGTFAKDLFPVMGDGKVPQTPYTTVKHKLQPPQHCAPAHPQGTSACAQHTSPACLTYRRFHRTEPTCCSLGQHTLGYIARLPMIQRCSQHNLPSCPRCMVARRGVRHCCVRGHHKVITPRNGRQGNTPWKIKDPHRRRDARIPIARTHSQGMLGPLGPGRGGKQHSAPP